MHNIHKNFIKIIGVLKDIIGTEINEKVNYKRRGSVPKFSDIEIFALSLTAECLVIDSENCLFSKLNISCVQAISATFAFSKYTSLGV